jgi:hypothetical protein
MLSDDGGTQIRWIYCSFNLLVAMEISRQGNRRQDETVVMNYLMESELIGAEPRVFSSVLAVVEDLTVETVVGIVTVLLPLAREL